MKELDINEMYEISGGMVGFNWGLFLKATFKGIAIGSSVYVANKMIA